MIRYVKPLGIVLLLQLVLVAVLFWPRSQVEQGLAGAPLLAIDTGQASRITISGGENSVVLDRNGNNWLMPEYHRLPADPDKMQSLLQTLPSLTRGWPVAQTDAALERFEVDEDSYQRRVSYFNGEQELGSVFLGTAPGFRKVHARPADASEVYAIEFNTFDIPAESATWMDMTLLQLEQVEAVQGLDYALTRNGETWQDPEGQAANDETIDSLVNGLQSLRVSGVADIATAGILDEVQAPPTLVVKSGDRELEYRLFEIEDAHYVRRADIPIYFSLSALDYDRLFDVTAANLFELAEAQAPAPGDVVSGRPAIDD